MEGAFLTVLGKPDDRRKGHRRFYEDTPRACLLIITVLGRYYKSAVLD